MKKMAKQNQKFQQLFGTAMIQHELKEIN